MKSSVRRPSRAVAVNRALGVIIALGVLLRVGVALYLGDRVEPVSGAYDQVSYDALAQRLLAGYGFSFPTAWYPFTPANQPTAHWSYLYTLYLAGVYALVGHHPLAARLIQALASGLHVWLAYRLARRLFFSPPASPPVSGGTEAFMGRFFPGPQSFLGRGCGGSPNLFGSAPPELEKQPQHVGDSPLPEKPTHNRGTEGECAALAAAALTAVYAYWIFFNAALMTQTFYVLAVLWALDLAIRLAFPASARETGSGGLKLWLQLGLALGLGALLRQTLLLFAPILLAWLGWAMRRQGDKEKGRQGDKESLTPSPSLSRSHLLIPIVVIILLVAPWSVYNYVTLGDFLLLNSNGGYWFWASNHPSRGVHFDGNYAPPIPEELHGLGEPALDRELYRRGLGFILADPVRFLRLSLSRINGYFWLLPSARSSLVSNLGRVLSFTIFLPFMLYGLWLSRRRWWVCLPLYLYIAFDTALHLVSWAAPRYRLPSDALLLVFAGRAVADLAGRAGRGRRGKGNLPLIGTGA